MVVSLLNDGFLSYVDEVTNTIIQAKNRWNNGKFTELYNKAIFKLILIDYYFINKFKELFIDLDLDMLTILSLDQKLLTRVNTSLDFSIRKYISSVFDETIDVKINLENVLTHYMETRSILSRFLYEYLKESDFNIKREVIKQIKKWLDNIQNTATDFFFNLKVPVVNTVETSYKIIFHQDMYKTFKNSLDNKKGSKPRILNVTAFINLVPLTFWFDGYEISVVAENTHQLRHLDFSIRQIHELSKEYHYRPSASLSELCGFNILYDDILKLERFGTLENNSYDGILSNFVISQRFKRQKKKETSNDEVIFTEKHIIGFFKKLHQLSKKNCLILVQEETIYQEKIEKCFADVGFTTMLKISTFEGFDRINWLIKQK